MDDIITVLPCNNLILPFSLKIIYIVLLYFYHGFQSGWASTVVLITFSTGLILMSLGIVGIYIEKIFEQTKDRPLYLIDETINLT